MKAITLSFTQFNWQKNFNFWFIIHQFALDCYHYYHFVINFLKVSRWRIYKKWNNSIEGTRINVPALFLPIKRPFVCSGLAQTLGKSHEPSISIKRASAPGHDPLVFSAHPGLRNLRCLPLLKERRGEIARLRTQRILERRQTVGESISRTIICRGIFKGSFCGHGKKLGYRKQPRVQ